MQPGENADLLARLKRLAKNLWWTWNQESQEIFQELSPRGWQDLYHNAVAVLQDISEYELNMRLQDPVFAQRVRNILKVFDAYMNRQDTWASRNAPAFADEPGGLLHGGVRFPRDAAHCGRRARNSLRRSRAFRQRPRARIRRHQPVLPRRIFSAVDQQGKLADGILLRR